MKVLPKVFTALIYVFLYAPLLIMVFFSFNSGVSTSVFSGFSLRWYESVFSSSVTMTALKNTLILALTSAAIATVIGTIAAVGIYAMKSRALQTAVKTVTNIPMINPDIVTGVSLMLLFVFAGKLLGLAESLNFLTLLAAHITFSLPYVILNVMPKLRMTAASYTEAALDLGCTPMKAFFKVIFPNISSGIFAGFLMAFTLSLDDFVISYYTNGADFQTLPLMIYSMTKRRVKPDMYALSSLIFIAVLVLLIAVNLYQIRSEKSQKRD
ncbi:MAG: ABC transporter permease [Acutalibacteraceae bacterium]